MAKYTDRRTAVSANRGEQPLFALARGDMKPGWVSCEAGSVSVCADGTWTSWAVDADDQFMSGLVYFGHRDDFPFLSNGVRVELENRYSSST